MADELQRLGMEVEPLDKTDRERGGTPWHQLAVTVYLDPTG